MKQGRVRHAMRGSALGNLLAGVLFLGLIALGAFLWLGRGQNSDVAQSQQAGGIVPTGVEPAPIEPVTGAPSLEAAAPYQPRNKVIDIDISEYAGYGGLIVANGGLKPNPDSFFAREYGFQVNLVMGESEEWSALNNGRIGVVATTADVMAVFGRQFETIVPVQISYSRGSDMVVVDRAIASINQLAGKVLAVSQFNESEFFIRFLAQEAGVQVTMLHDLDARPPSNQLGLVYYADAFVACDAYEHELAKASPRLNGCVGWTPRTDEVVKKSAGKAKVLVSNRNLLVVADVLAVNKGFAKQHPEMVQGLVHGLMEGNRRLRDNQAENIAVVAKAFGWTDDKARNELSYIHLSNLPENRAFFAGTIDSAGSFGGIFQSSVLAYGSVIKNPTDPARFMDTNFLDALAKKNLFSEQKIAIAPIRTATNISLEGDPLLSKDIRFYFEANSAVLDRTATQNQEYLDTIKRFLQVSPGSTVVLRGHVDNGRVAEFRQKGGSELVQSMGLKAMELSRQRALAVQQALLAKYPNIQKSSVESVGRGWEEPVSGENSELNRRVEAQWFTIE